MLVKKLLHKNITFSKHEAIKSRFWTFYSINLISSASALDARFFIRAKTFKVYFPDLVNVAMTHLVNKNG